MPPKQYKTSNQITRIYSVGYQPPGGLSYYASMYQADYSPLLRAARYLRKKGSRGRIVLRPYGRSVIVVLVASKATHKEAVAQLKRREGISVSWNASARSGSRGLRHRKKGNWTTKSAHCSLCGVCTSVYREGRSDELCSKCKGLHPLQQIVVGIYGELPK